MTSAALAHAFAVVAALLGFARGFFLALLLLDGRELVVALDVVGHLEIALRVCVLREPSGRPHSEGEPACDRKTHQARAQAPAAHFFRQPGVFSS